MAVCLGLIGRPQFGHASALRETSLSQSGHMMRFCVDIFLFHVLRVVLIATNNSRTVHLLSAIPCAMTGVLPLRVLRGLTRSASESRLLVV